MKAAHPSLHWVYKTMIRESSWFPITNTYIHTSSPKIFRRPTICLSSFGPGPSPLLPSPVPRNDGGVCQPELVTRKALTYFRRSMAAAAFSSLLSLSLLHFIYLPSITYECMYSWLWSNWGRERERRKEERKRRGESEEIGRRYSNSNINKRYWKNSVFTDTTPEKC